MTKKNVLLDDLRGTVDVGAERLKALRRIGEAASAVGDSLNRFDNAVTTMRDSLGAEPVSTPADELISALRLIAYVQAALSDPVVRRTPSSAELAADLLWRLEESVLDEFGWPSLVRTDIAAGVSAHSSDISKRRSKVKARDAFKEWIKSSEVIVDHVDDFRSMPSAPIPQDVFEYIMRSSDRALRDAYNEERPGTLKPGRRSSKN